MRINGLSVAPPPIKTLVFPGRLEGGVDLVLKFQPVLNLKHFDEEIFKRPDPPIIKYADGRIQRDINDIDYQKAVDEWATARVNYMVLKSIEATPGIEWDTVKESDSSTWGNYREELESVLSETEIAMVIRTVNEVSCMDQSMIDEATKSFLAKEQELQEKLSQKEEQHTTQNGEPVKDSESDQAE